MALLNTLKKVAEQTNQAGVPTAFFYGTVTGISPLRILVDSRFEIDETVIVVPRQFRAGEYLTHRHTVPHAHSIPTGQTEETEGHRHGLPSQETEEEQAQTDTEEYLGLTVGEKVVLLRNQGGEEFLVLGRV